MKLSVKKGTTSKVIEVFIPDSSSSTGAGLTGLEWDSSGLSWYYSREDDGDEGGTEVTLATATRGTYQSGGFVEKDATNLPGVYQIGIPNACLATGAGWCVMMLKGATDMAPVPVEIQLTENTAADVITQIALVKAVTDLLNTAQGEPTGVPAVDETPLNKIAHLFRALRNKVTITSDKKTFHDDLGTADWEKDLSDDGTTYEETEANAV